MALTEQEQEEVKALQDLRKGAGQGGAQFSDSQRARLSELLKKEDEGKETKDSKDSGKEKKTVSAAPASK